MKAKHDRVYRPWSLKEESEFNAIKKMREAGLSFAQIGDLFSITRQGAHDKLQRLILRRSRPQAKKDHA